MYRECCMHLLQRHYAKIMTWDKDGPSISERRTISECGMWYDSESAMPDLIQTTSPLASTSTFVCGDTLPNHLYKGHQDPKSFSI